MSAKLVVGIDLGTTHCALAVAQLAAPQARVEVLPIEQLVAPGAAEKRTLLPSFLYFAHDSEAPLALPWDGERRFAVFGGFLEVADDRVRIVTERAESK